MDTIDYEKETIYNDNITDDKDELLNKVLEDDSQEVSKKKRVIKKTKKKPDKKDSIVLDISNHQIPEETDEKKDNLVFTELLSRYDDTITKLSSRIDSLEKSVLENKAQDTEDKERLKMYNQKTSHDIESALTLLEKIQKDHTVNKDALDEKYDAIYPKLIKETKSLFKDTCKIESEKLESIKNDFDTTIKKEIQELNRKYETRLETEIFEISKSVAKDVDALKEAMSNLSESLGETLKKAVKSIDDKVKDKIHDYSSQFVSETRDLETILTLNKDVLDRIKNQSNVVNFLSREVKKDLQIDLESYKNKIMLLNKDSDLRQTLEKLSRETDTILKNNAMNNDIISLVKNLRLLIDTDKSVLNITS